MSMPVSGGQDLVRERDAGIWGAGRKRDAQRRCQAGAGQPSQPCLQLLLGWIYEPKVTAALFLEQQEKTAASKSQNGNYPPEWPSG